MSTLAISAYPKGQRNEVFVEAPEAVAWSGNRHLRPFFGLKLLYNIVSPTFARLLIKQNDR